MKNKIRAVFIDHMGTIVAEEGKYAKEVIRRAYLGSDALSPEEMAGFWFGTMENLMKESYGDDFKTVYEISMEAFGAAKKKYHIKADLSELYRILEMSWVFADPFEDTREFFQKCPVPVYVLSNNDDKYIAKAIKNLKINPAGVITSEMARAYKPRKEIFEEALRVSSCMPNEVVHLGDSITNDVLGAQAVGIEPWLLDRNEENKRKDLQSFRSLLEALGKIILESN